MGLLDAYKIRKALAVLLTLRDPAHPRTVQALSTLKEIGRPVLAEFVEALGSAKHPESIEELLAAFLDNETLPFFVHQLAHPNAQVATGVTKVFVRSTKYDPTRLLTLCADAKIPKVALGRILAQRQDQLQLKPLIALLGTADRDGRAVLLRLIERSATEAMLPDVIWATRSKDPVIRLSMARTLGRFSTEAVREALSGLLNDRYKEVRQAALDGLARLRIPLDAGAICQMLRDPEPAIQTQTKDVLIRRQDPQTAHVLGGLLIDEAEDVRQRTVDVLNAMADGLPVRTLLVALRDKEWWVKVRVFEALRAAGESRLFEAVVSLCKDEDAYIRGSAVEILKQDQRAFDYLIAALENHDADTRVRTVEVLAGLEDKRAVPVFLRLLRETPEVGPVVLPALAKLGGTQAISPMVQCLQGTNPGLCKAALRALATITDAAHAEQVLKAVMAVRDTADAELKAVANGTASALISKFGAAAVGRSRHRPTPASRSCHPKPCCMSRVAPRSRASWDPTSLISRPLSSRTGILRATLMRICCNRRICWSIAIASSAAWGRGVWFGHPR